MMNIIETQHYSVTYGASAALADITISFPEKQVTALIGPSGCGKSTLLRSFNRMNDLIPEARHDGLVTFKGKDIHAPGIDVTRLRRDIGMVFQKPAPFPMSIHDNVAYGPRMQGVRDKGTLDDIVERALRQAALWDEVKDRLKKSALSLSGGQQQRLCLARALAVSPEVLLMDEPTASLDPIATMKVEGLVNDLKKNYTIVIVTHSMLQARRIADRTAFFYMGRLVEDGETATIFTSPRFAQTEDYVNGRFG